MPASSAEIERDTEGEEQLGGQALLWFGIAGGAALFALSLLHARYVQKAPRAVQSRGAFTMFAVFMLIFAIGAAAAGIAAARLGR